MAKQKSTKVPSRVDANLDHLNEDIELLWARIEALEEVTPNTWDGILANTSRQIQQAAEKVMHKADAITIPTKPITAEELLAEGNGILTGLTIRDLDRFNCKITRHSAGMLAARLNERFGVK